MDGKRPFLAFKVSALKVKRFFYKKVKEIGLLFSLFSIELWKALSSSDTDKKHQ